MFARPCPQDYTGRGCLAAPSVDRVSLSTDVHPVVHMVVPRLFMGGSCLQDLDQLGHLVVDLLAFLHEPLDLVDRMDHRRVVPPAELAGDGNFG